MLQSMRRRIAAFCFYILFDGQTAIENDLIRCKRNRKEERKVSKLSPKRFKGSIILLCKLAIMALTAGAFLYLVTHYYPETDFWFKGYLVFVFLYLVVFLALASTYNSFNIGTMRYRELLFTYILSSTSYNFV